MANASAETCQRVSAANIILTTSGIDDPQVLDLALNAVGDDNIMLAINAPNEDTAAAIAFLQSAQFTTRTAQI